MTPKYKPFRFACVFERTLGLIKSENECRWYGRLITHNRPWRRPAKIFLKSHKSVTWCDNRTFFLNFPINYNRMLLSFFKCDELDSFDQIVWDQFCAFRIEPNQLPDRFCRREGRRLGLDYPHPCVKVSTWWKVLLSIPRRPSVMRAAVKISTWWRLIIELKSSRWQ